jgi:molecular chaperone GrpE
MSEPSPTPETQPEVLPPETEAAAAEPTAPLDPIEAAQAEIAQWKDLAYRNAAELDNFRKRAAREAQDTRAYANADLLRSLFPILDNFEMGLEAARAESEKSMIFMGMNMVHRQISVFLREQGVQEVEALGKAFDPNLHDAVAQEHQPGAAEGIVLRVTRRGYKLKDRLLRAASVVVSGAPTPAETAPVS